VYPRRENAYLQRWQTGFNGSAANYSGTEIDYWFGSGDHAPSYINRTASGELIELSLTWYSENWWHFLAELNRIVRRPRTIRASGSRPLPEGWARRGFFDAGGNALPVITVFDKLGMCLTQVDRSCELIVGQTVLPSARAVGAPDEEGRQQDCPPPSPPPQQRT
jgi:hypothetical protein